MNPLLLIAILTSFFCTFLAMPFWIRKAKQIGLVWEDMHKKSQSKNIAGSGGVVLVLGFTLGVLLYIAINTFYFNSTENLIEIFALLSSLFLVSGIALIDDLFGWQHGGLSKRSRLILVVFAAIPLMVINAGESTMMGIEFGILYPLLLIPIGILELFEGGMGVDYYPKFPKYFSNVSILNFLKLSDVSTYQIF